jgi:hypothetical protein
MISNFFNDYLPFQIIDQLKMYEILTFNYLKYITSTEILTEKQQISLSPSDILSINVICPYLN